jgi:hypothetical protein
VSRYVLTLIGADFTQAGEHGELPADFQEWRRGLTYTVRPELLRPIPPTRELRLNVTVRQVALEGASRPSFADLYERAATIMDARISTLRCHDATALGRAWILAQAWFVNELGDKSVYSASITSAVSFLNDGSSVPMGEPRPDAAALLVPSGGTPEAFAAKHVNDHGSKRLDEICVDFRHSEPVRDITISYGEYVAGCEGVDYAPIVERAARLARFHYDTLSARDGAAFDILRSEWTCLSTNKAVDSSIATVHIYFRI